MNNFLKNRFYETVTVESANLTSFLKVHHITVSKKDIRKWEQKHEEENNKRICFKGCEEKSFEVEIREGCRHISSKIKLIDEDTHRKYVYSIDNETSEFIIGEYTFTLGIDFNQEDEENEQE